MCLKRFICWLFNKPDLAFRGKKESNDFEEIYNGIEFTAHGYIPTNTSLDPQYKYITAEDQGFVLAEAQLPQAPPSLVWYGNQKIAKNQ